jgi:hypothetical protein
MNLFGRKSQPVRRRRGRKKTWLDTAALESTPLVEKMKTSNPVLLASIVRQVTGVDIKPEDIKTETPEEAFEAKVLNAAMKDIEKDTEFMQDAKNSILDELYRGSPSGRMKRGRNS